MNIVNISKNRTTLTRLGQILEETIVFEIDDLAAFIDSNENVVEEKFIGNLLLYIR